QALAALTRSLRELASDVADRQMRLALSVCDGGSPEPGLYRHALVGPASRALTVMESLRGEGHENGGVARGQAPVALGGEGPEGVTALAPYLHWVHLSNVVLGQGDTHPSFSQPQSQIGPPQLAAFLHALAEVNYGGPLGVAVRPSNSEVPERVIRVA